MGALLHFLLLFSTTTVVLVAADSSTSHYLSCLHESQCKKAFNGSYCCPSGTCCHFYMWESSKVKSVCKRIRPDQTYYCQDRDKRILSDQDLLDKRFYDGLPSKGKVCIRRQKDQKVFCFGGTDSEEDEYKAKEGTGMTPHDALALLQGQGFDFVSVAEGVDKSKMRQYIAFSILNRRKHK